MNFKKFFALCVVAGIAWNCSDDSSNTTTNIPNDNPSIVVTEEALFDAANGIVIYQNGTVTDINGTVVGTFDATTNTVIKTDGSTTIIDMNTLVVVTPSDNTPADMSSASENGMSSAGLVESAGSTKPEDTTTPNTSSTSTQNPDPETTSSSSESVIVSTTGNPEEDIKLYPVPTLQTVLGNGTSGWSSRYWDACKPHCSWAEEGKNDRPDISSQEKYEQTYTSARNCNIHDIEVPTFTLSQDVQQYWYGTAGTPSACEVKTSGVFVCTDMAPVAVNDTLAYAFVAGKAGSTTCGQCFHLQFDGNSHANDPKPTHKALKGKHMIVMTSNIGGDVEEGQFDMMVPGGGVGIFDALSIQVSGASVNWGAQYGGFLTECQTKKGLGYNASLQEYQTCVKQMCDDAFANSGYKNLLRGCHWYADWYMAADNPTYQWERVECPQYLVDKFKTTISTSVDTKYLAAKDWSKYEGGELPTTEACHKENIGGKYCDEDQLAADKAKAF